ncbi:MAG: hypothetical protein MAG431_01565 [Chloroflexi bacterium]|nr:hypothetical protein [Chloroflexota bacterium]
MTTITIALPDDRLRALEKLSDSLKVSPEELVRANIEELLSHPEEAFEQVSKYVLEKNEKLYQRLAS